jgi:hypothetical protein
LLHAFDLHVLGMPPAFVLSQDQTLKLASLLWEEKQAWHRTSALTSELTS